MLSVRHVVTSLMLLGVTAALVSQEPLVTRIIYFEGIAPREAMTLLRSEVGVRQIAVISDLSALIVKDSPERVASCEEVLQGLGFVAATDDPHGPELPTSPLDQTPTETRTFRVKGIDRRDVSPLLRAIYSVRDLDLPPGEEALSVTAPAVTLDNIEATLRALGVLGRAGG